MKNHCGRMRRERVMRYVTSHQGREVWDTKFNNYIIVGPNDTRYKEKVKDIREGDVFYFRRTVVQ